MDWVGIEDEEEFPEGAESGGHGAGDGSSTHNSSSNAATPTGETAATRGLASLRILSFGTGHSGKDSTASTAAGGGSSATAASNSSGHRPGGAASAPAPTHGVLKHSTAPAGALAAAGPGALAGGPPVLTALASARADAWSARVAAGGGGGTTSGGSPTAGGPTGAPPTPADQPLTVTDTGMSGPLSHNSGTLPTAAMTSSRSTIAHTVAPDGRGLGYSARITQSQHSVAATGAAGGVGAAPVSTGGGGLRDTSSSVLPTDRLSEAEVSAAVIMITA